MQEDETSHFPDEEAAVSALQPDLPPALEAETAEGEPEFLMLDSRVINLWRLNQLIAAGFLMALAMGGGMVLGFSVPGSFPFVVGAWVGLLLLLLVLAFWYPRRAWRAWGYRVNEKVLETRHGVWWQIAEMLPLSRLQHVDLQRGPIERACGLASLVLHTAGTQQAAIQLPGLDAETAARLRDELVTRGGDDGV